MKGCSKVGDESELSFPEDMSGLRISKAEPLAYLNELLPRSMLVSFPGKDESGNPSTPPRELFPACAKEDKGSSEGALEGSSAGSFAGLFSLQNASEQEGPSLKGSGVDLRGDGGEREGEESTEAEDNGKEEKETEDNVADSSLSARAKYWPSFENGRPEGFCAGDIAKGIIMRVDGEGIFVSLTRCCDEKETWSRGDGVMEIF